MQLLVAIDRARGIIRLCETNFIDTAIRNIRSRMKIDYDDIHQAQSYSATTIERIHDILRRFRFVNSNRWSKEYLLNSYRVKVVLKLIGCGHLIKIKDNEYDVLRCSHCNENIEAQYTNVNNIIELIAILNQQHYCSDECEANRDKHIVSYCVMCNNKMQGSYVTCSAKCEIAYRHQKSNKRDTTTNRDIEHVWTTRSDKVYYCKNCEARIANKREKEFCSLDCRLEYKKH